MSESIGAQTGNTGFLQNQSAWILSYLYGERSKTNSCNGEIMEENKEIRMDEKVKVISLAPWTTSAMRKTSIGDIMIAAYGTAMIPREELIAQSQSGNKLLNGKDGNGAHATWYIDDEFTRKYLGYETDTEKQDFLTDDDVRKIFLLKTQKSFEDRIRQKIVTRAEQIFLMESIQRLGINDYKRIRFCIEYTGYKI